MSRPATATVVAAAVKPTRRRRTTQRFSAEELARAARIGTLLLERTRTEEELLQLRGPVHA